MDRHCPTCSTPLPHAVRPEFCPVCTLQAALRLDEARPPEPARLPVRHIGDYELLDEIARGGVGVIYRARQVSLGREVALKLLIAGQFADPTARQRFRAEATSAARLNHPHIVQIHEVGEYEGQPFLAMELLEGGDLGDHARRHPLPYRQAAQLVATIARAIAHAHAQGICHRDLKPSNILLDAFGEPRVTDFGLAKHLDAPGDLTLVGQVLGSPGFMAPEQAAGRVAEVGPAADLYALGAILYHLLVGRPPFHGESTAQVLRQVIEDDPIPPRRLDPDLPRDLGQIALKALEKAPGRRFASAAEMADDLDRFLAGRPVRARPLSAIGRAWRWSRREPGMALALLLLLVVAVGSTFAALRIRRAEIAAQDHLAEARQHAYARDLALADRAIEEFDLARTRELLERHLPGTGDDLRTFEWHLLWTLSSDEAATVLRGHHQAVTSLDFFPDGQRLVSGSWDGSVRLWSLTQTNPVLTLTEYQGRIWAVDVSPDGRRLIAAGEQGVAAWNLDPPAFRGRIQGNYGYGTALFLPDGRRVVVATRQQLDVWNIDDGTRERRFTDLSSPVALSADGTRLAARRFRSLTILDTTTWSPLRQVPTGTLASFGLRDLAFTRDGQHLWCGDVRGWIGIVAANGPASNLVQLSYSPVHPQPHRGWVGEIVASPDGKTMASVGADQGVVLWNTTTRRPRLRGRGHRHEVWAAAFSPDNRWLATAGKDETIRLWDAQRRPPRSTVTANLPRVLGPWNAHSVLAEPPTTNGLRRLQVYDWKRRQVAAEFAFDSLPAGAVPAFSGATRRLAFDTTDAHREVWSVADREPRRLARWPVGPAVATALRFSQRGNRLAASDPAAPGASIWDPETGRRLASLSGPGEVVDLDDTYAVALAAVHTPVVYEVRTGRRLTQLTGHKENISGTLLLPDRRTVVTAAWDGTLRFWELPSGRLLAAKRSQFQGVYALGLSPDGRTLAAAGQDGVTYFWNVATREQTIRWVERRAVEQLWFTPDGQTLLQHTGAQLIALSVAETPAPDPFDPGEAR